MSARSDREEWSVRPSDVAVAHAQLSRRGVSSAISTRAVATPRTTHARRKPCGVPKLGPGGGVRFAVGWSAPRKTDATPLGSCKEIRSFLRTFAATSVGCSRSAAQVATSRVPFATVIGRGRRSRLLEEPCGRLSTRCETLVTSSLHDKVRLELDEAFFVRQPRLSSGSGSGGRRKIHAHERCRF